MRAVGPNVPFGAAHLEGAADPPDVGARPGRGAVLRPPRPPPLRARAPYGRATATVESSPALTDAQLLAVPTCDGV